MSLGQKCTLCFSEPLVELQHLFCRWWVFRARDLLGLSLVVRHGLASCSLRAIASPNPRGPSFFSRQSHWSSGCPIHLSTHSLRLAPGVVSSCAPACLWRFVRRRILTRIVLQASLIFCAIPECFILAWRRAIRPLS
jgi:hypothetical protein